ncbi:MAG TPA: AAA family ATPase [Solirubrobacteraceae bacterium]|nr:AAA family ATPase [Solirubrobacteraceae bacterium]
MPATGVVGRDGELAQIETALAAARGPLGALAIEGEPGIGKTTVLREVRQRALGAGARVLSCRASEAEASLSFAGLADLLAAADEAALAALPPAQREAIEVALLRAPPGDRAHSPHTVGAAVLALLRMLADERQLVLAVDDVQWLDAPSSGALEFALRRLGGSDDVRLIYSVRTPAAPVGLGAAVPPDGMHRLALAGVSLPALAEIISSRLGVPLPRPLLVQISQTSRGNPLYALEIARLVRDAGLERAPAPTIPVPDDLRALVAQRIDALPAPTLEALLLTAVLANPARSMVDHDALAPARRAGIVTDGPGAAIEFAHPLFASAVLASVTGRRRRELHRRAAELASDPEQCARHLALGVAGPDHNVASQLERAATLAALRGAPDAAAGLAELAAQRTPAARVHDRALRLLDAGRFYFDAGDLERTEALAHEVLSTPASRRLRSRALQLLVQCKGRRSSFTAAAELAGAGLALAEGDPAVQAGLELELAFCSSSLGAFPQTVAHARAAVKHAETAADGGLLAEALAVVTMAQFLCGGGTDEARLARALELEDPDRNGSLVMRPRYIQGLLQLWSGELDEAMDTLSTVREQTAERGQESVLPLQSLYLVWAAVWRGQLAQATAVAVQARQAASLVGDPASRALALSASALADAHRGRACRVRTDAGQALELFEQLRWRSGVIWPLWALGSAALAEGDAAAVDGLLRPLADQLTGMGAGDPVLGMFVPDEVEALVILGDLDRAEAYLEPFARRASDLDRGWARAAAARCLGALLAARGDPAAAFAAFDEALAQYARITMPIERARALLLAGQAHRRYKHRGQARALLTEAIAHFERAGAPGWAARAHAELARVGHRTLSPDHLTEAESRVAELVASGLSNREVAARLFVSVKTVEANLTRVYRKLGVRSRTGLAGSYALRGVPAEPQASET